MPDTFTAPKPKNIESPVQFLLWLVTSQRRRVAAGAALGSLWMVGNVVPPYLLSRAIDDGLKEQDTGALIGWAAALLGIGMVNAALAIARHRTMTKMRMDATFRTVRATISHATYLGATVPRRVATGEIVTIGMSDVQVIAQSLTVTGPGVGAVVAYVVVAGQLLAISAPIAAVVLAGVPLLAVTVGPLLHRLRHVDTGHRTRQAALTSRLVDVVTGMRTLNGLGGKGTYAHRYHRESQALRDSGYRVGAVTSWIGALGTGLPALFLAVVTWLAARMAADGSISIGDLVAVYGYVAVLAIPVSFFIEGSSDISRATVAARRVTRFLSLTPDHTDPAAGTATTLDAPPPRADLHDPVSGVEVRHALLTAIVCARSADSASVIERLGRFVPSDATWGGVRLDSIPLGHVRDRILVADNDADLFAGSLREIVTGRHDPDDDAIREALHTAVATDIVDALPEGLDSVIAAQGRDISGGQRQRLRLARAVYATPDVLLAIEPTSAVDAHTEGAIAARLRAARKGRTTVIATTSPLLLDRADVVVHVVDGRVAATGSHRDLSRTEPGYRALLSRDADEETVR
ncbi:ABC transporter transmembrane domain-containing protein [Streptomyces sp. CG1]|uniref:ABC transporter transmembrane domain-containing protein n=1 Tax=Streptomyces sp. CG1 TaxID=1287523 RepID=UPI0034E25CD7